jgi:hypothetical protein
MRSAFGIDHGEFSKARRGPGVTRGRRDPATSMVPRGGGGTYYNPTKEQRLASQQRRTAQAKASVEHKANKPNVRVGGGKKYPLKMAMNEVGELKGLNRVVRHGTVAGAGLLAGTYGANRYIRHRDSVQKDDNQNRDRARVVASGVVGGVGGKLLAGAGTNMGGQLAKGKLKQRRAMRGSSPNEDKIWREHKAKYANPTERHLKYPKSLPDWRAQRLLAFKNRPAVGRGALIAGAGLGAAYGVHEARKK